MDLESFQELTLQPVFPLAFTCLYVAGTTYLQPASDPPRAPPAKPGARKVLKTSNYIIFLHNLILAVYSMWTFFNSFTIIRDDFASRSTHDTHCDAGKTRWNGTQFGFITWLFYMSKYYEVLDTVIIIAKGRRPMFLQTFHHAGAILLMWHLTLQGNPMVWVFVVFNSFIHSLMYVYYALTAVGHAPAWKMAMTMLQLAQFAAGNVVCSYPYFNKGCLTAEETWTLTAVLTYVTVLIVLFTLFAIKSYCKPASDKQKKP